MKAVKGFQVNRERWSQVKDVKGFHVKREWWFQVKDVKGFQVNWERWFRVKREGWMEVGAGRALLPVPGGGFRLSGGPSSR